MRFEHLEDFVTRYNPRNRHERTATWSEETPGGRWRPYTREELLARDKASLDVFWLKDEAMTDLKNILASRADFYSKARYRLDTSGQGLDATFEALRELVDTDLASILT